jgi:hypothetical protein
MNILAKFQLEVFTISDSEDDDFELPIVAKEDVDNLQHNYIKHKPTMKEL